METFGLLLHGLGLALTPLNLLYALIGVTLGTAVGVLPGIGPALTVALLLPVTYGLAPISAFIMFAGIYYGGMYGGSTTSILLNTPGESASIVTALEIMGGGQKNPRMRDMVNALRADIESGSSLSEAITPFASVWRREYSRHHSMSGQSSTAVFLSP